MVSDIHRLVPDHVHTIPYIENADAKRGEKMGNLKPKVGIAYHFFAEYRSAVIYALSQSDEYEFVFWGARTDPAESGIQEMYFDETISFQKIRSIQGPKGLLIQPEILRLSLDNSYDAIIFLGNWKYIVTWPSVITAKLTGKKILFWTHGWIKNEKGIVGLVRNLFYSLSDGLLLYGNRAKEICIDKGWDTNRLAVVYNSLDYPQQIKLREKLTQQSRDELRTRIWGDSSTPVIVSIGRITKRKQIDMLLHSANYIWNVYSKKVNVLVIGDGPEVENLQKLSSELKVNVHFYGVCFDEKILANLIGSATVAVAPASVGLTIMHTLAYGVPMITHDVFDLQGPEAEAIRPGINGDFYRYGSIEDLSVKIINWIQHSYPPDEVREQCMSIIDEFYNPDYQVEVIESALFSM